MKTLKIKLYIIVFLLFVDIECATFKLVNPMLIKYIHACRAENSNMDQTIVVINWYANRSERY